MGVTLPLFESSLIWKDGNEGKTKGIPLNPRWMICTENEQFFLDDVLSSGFFDCVFDGGLDDEIQYQYW